MSASEDQYKSSSRTNGLAGTAQSVLEVEEHAKLSKRLSLLYLQLRVPLDKLLVTNTG